MSCEYCDDDDDDDDPRVFVASADPRAVLELEHDATAREWVRNTEIGSPVKMGGDVIGNDREWAVDEIRITARTITLYLVEQRNDRP